jgi:hypothetical protein
MNRRMPSAWRRGPGGSCGKATKRDKLET